MDGPSRRYTRRSSRPTPRRRPAALLTWRRWRCRRAVPAEAAGSEVAGWAAVAGEAKVEVAEAAAEGSVKVVAEGAEAAVDSGAEAMAAVAMEVVAETAAD